MQPHISEATAAKIKEAASKIKVACNMPDMKKFAEVKTILNSLFKSIEFSQFEATRAIMAGVNDVCNR